MVVHIDNNEYTLQSDIYCDVEKIWFNLPVTFEEASLLGNAPAIRVTDGSFDESYTVVTMKSICTIDGMDGVLQVTWMFDSVEKQLEQQLAKKEAELETAKNEMLAIKTAIKNLGTGIPTLTKLTSFLSAVKEAIHYDGDN